VQIVARRHGNDLPLDQLEPLFFPEDASLDHALHVRDRKSAARKAFGSPCPCDVHAGIISQTVAAITTPDVISLRLNAGVGRDDRRLPNPADYPFSQQDAAKRGRERPI